MKEMLEKMGMRIKAMLVNEYGEAFTSLSKEEQAGVMLKVMSDLVQTDSRISTMLGSKYLEDIEENTTTPSRAV